MPFWVNTSGPKFPTLFFFSDGGLRLSPPAASAAVLVKDRQGRIVDWFSRVMPPLSNNEAEYQGLLDALDLALKLQPARAVFHLDSQIVVGQVSGRFATRDPRLKRLCLKAQQRLHQLELRRIKAELLFIPREFNLLADALAADALLIIPERHVFNTKPEINRQESTEEV